MESRAVLWTSPRHPPPTSPIHPISRPPARPTTETSTPAKYFQGIPPAPIKPRPVRPAPSSPARVAGAPEEGPTACLPRTCCTRPSPGCSPQRRWPRSLSPCRPPPAPPTSAPAACSGRTRDWAAGSGGAGRLGNEAESPRKSSGSLWLKQRLAALGRAPSQPGALPRALYMDEPTKSCGAGSREEFDEVDLRRERGAAPSGPCEPPPGGSGSEAAPPKGTLARAPALCPPD